MRNKLYKTFFNDRISVLHLLFLIFIIYGSDAQTQRVPVLAQIDLPHNYYHRELYLPQLTSGPSSVDWSPDGKSLIYSMAGSLWIQATNKDTAVQLTEGSGYDYQPDWSPDGNQIVFTRYDGRSMELMILDLKNKKEFALTRNMAVTVEPRWSPDGEQLAFVSTENTGHFLLYTAKLRNNALTEIICLTPDRQSMVKRYYYSSFDHSINPVWSPDGKQIYFVSNREIAHGTGDIVSLTLNSDRSPAVICREETSWRARPDISPDGTRLIYSSYLGRNWNQLWLLPAEGGYPIPLTYGEYDNTYPKWSPDGMSIAFISNRTGNTSLWLIDTYTGEQKQVRINHLSYLFPRKPLHIIVHDEKGVEIPARLSVLDSRGKFYAPGEAWIHADDSVFPAQQKFESHYFHTVGSCEVLVPEDPLSIVASFGPEYEIAKLQVDARTEIESPLIIKMEKLNLPDYFDDYWNGDLHVHMNYGGHYRNTPEKLVRQAQAENLNFIYNLIVNKEQRIPDIGYFSPDADLASTEDVLIFHAQEYHTSFWGHLGLLNLTRNYLVPDYAGYPLTAVESLFPNNPYIARKAREQEALVGYVHPFYASQLYPKQSETLTNDLPVNAALGNIDYYELVGFSHHFASGDVWHKLLNCGLRIPAGAGTDAMANYASLRGPVGLNRIFVKGKGSPDRKTILENIKVGRSFVTNGPLVGLKVNGAEPGDIIQVKHDPEKISYQVFFRSAIPVDFVDLIWNGKIIERFVMEGSRKELDRRGETEIQGPGWMLVRAWSEDAHPDLPDFYPYASTNPIYFENPGKVLRSASAAEYFLIWIERLDKAARTFRDYRNMKERDMILADIEQARQFYLNCKTNATID